MCSNEFQSVTRIHIGKNSEMLQKYMCLGEIVRLPDLLEQWAMVYISYGELSLQFHNK